MRVALADDSALFRHGLASLLTAAEVEVTAAVPNGTELAAAVRTDPPDAIILDIRMPPTFSDEGITTALKLRAESPGLAALVLSTYAESDYAVRLLAEGAAGVGYLLKDRVDDIAALRDTLRRLIRGESVIEPEIVNRLMERQTRLRDLEVLTDRETAVLRLMAEGRSNAGISQALHLSSRTVENHAAAVFAKLGLASSPVDNRRVLAVLTWLRATSI